MGRYASRKGLFLEEAEIWEHVFFWKDSLALYFTTPFSLFGLRGQM